ncbi:GNAT family N-acetyltransferase [Natrinema pallidum]|uniref:Siderophore biosynthesis protein, conserved region n=1 Tax=Natrinema pallidum DSM 3751 TaxID=1227495 RepID=L9YYA7_9EURY|nr:GNAT family N-acetyltransferase [Natrinema pallidum]ELY79245.1 Siderophore biosynthesis protein, conserved region [Natrinema pallidum DSM 3751]
MTAPEPTRGSHATVASAYDFEYYDETIDCHIGFRPVSLERDLGRLHAWLGSEHVKPYWDLDEPLPTFRETLREKLADDHQTLYVGCLDHVPMSYWERYWAAADDVAAYYDAEPADQGIHLLIGPEAYLGEGYAVPLLRAMVALQFRHPETDRIVAEPDARNEAVLATANRCGFEPRREFEFREADKTATLAVCTRERFEREVWPPTADGADLRSPEVSDGD